MSDLNLYQRRNAAKKAVYDHEFSKIISQGLKYKYLPIEQIKPIVEKAWNDVGIVMDLGELEISDVRQPWEVKSEYGTISMWYHLKGTLTLTLVNVDDPNDRKDIIVCGEAKDNSDKTINKVYTAALKNFYKHEFNIVEGPKDDTDAIQSDAALEEPVTAKKKAVAADPFFGKKATPPSTEFTTADKVAVASDAIPAEAELNTILNVKGAQPKFKELVINFKVSHDAKSIYDLSFDEKVELYNIIRDMEGSQ